MTHDCSTPFGNPQFLVLAGSRLYGIDTPESDYDYVGALVEPVEYRIGLSNYHFSGGQHQHGFEQYLVKGDEHEGSVYSLWKLAQMLAEGNPTILCLMFADPIRDDFGICTDEFRSMVVNRRSGFRFLKYMQAQKKSMVNERSKNVTRTDLIERYGFDTKFAGHVIRLGYQGIEFLETGAVRLPMIQYQRDVVMDIRMGKYSIGDVLYAATELEGQMLAALEKTALPEQPNMQALNKWLAERYFGSWNLVSRNR